MVPSNFTSSTLSPNRDLKGVTSEVYQEKALIWGQADFTNNGFVDHINTTKDTTDYLWYTTRLVTLQRYYDIFIHILHYIVQVCLNAIIMPLFSAIIFDWLIRNLFQTGKSSLKHPICFPVVYILYTFQPQLCVLADQVC